MQLVLRRQLVLLLPCRQLRSWWRWPSWGPLPGLSILSVVVGLCVVARVARRKAAEEDTHVCQFPCCSGGCDCGSRLLLVSIKHRVNLPHNLSNQLTSHVLVKLAQRTPAFNLRASKNRPRGANNGQAIGRVQSKFMAATGSSVRSKKQQATSVMLAGQIGRLAIAIQHSHHTHSPVMRSLDLGSLQMASAYSLKQPEAMDCKDGGRGETRTRDTGVIHYRSR